MGQLFSWFTPRTKLFKFIFNSKVASCSQIFWHFGNLHQFCLLRNPRLGTHTVEKQNKISRHSHKSPFTIILNFSSTSVWNPILHQGMSQAKSANVFTTVEKKCCENLERNTVLSRLFQFFLLIFNFFVKFFLHTLELKYTWRVYTHKKLK